MGRGIIPTGEGSGKGLGPLARKKERFFRVFFVNFDQIRHVLRRISYSFTDVELQNDRYLSGITVAHSTHPASHSR